jgi:hypothetical protein
MNKPVVVVEKTYPELVTKMKELGLSVEICSVTVRAGVTRPGAEGQFSSNRADVEVAATVSIDATADDSREKFDAVVDSLLSLVGGKAKKTVKRLN